MYVHVYKLNVGAINNCFETKENHNNEKGNGKTVEEYVQNLTAFNINCGLWSSELFLFVIMINLKNTSPLLSTISIKEGENSPTYLFI